MFETFKTSNTSKQKQKTKHVKSEHKQYLHISPNKSMTLFISSKITILKQ